MSEIITAEVAKLREGILYCLEEKDVKGIKTLLQDIDDPMMVFQAMQDLSRNETIIVFRLLPKDAALFVFEQLDPFVQEELLESFKDEYARMLFEDLSPDDRVALLDEMPAKVAKRLLGLLSPEERRVTYMLMGYEAETAGRIMTPYFISLRPDMTVDQALAKIRVQAKDEEKETIYTLYVTDNAKKLLGNLSLRRLLTAEPNQKVEDIMHEALVKVSTDTDQEEVAHTLKDYDLLSIPVVDREGRIVGIVTVDDAIDILEEEATEDILNKAGLAKGRGESCRSEAMIRGSLWSVWKVRLPFLIITLFGGLLAGSVLGFFEETLEAIIIAAMFIPVVMDMGGNVGVQSSTIFQRGALLGHITQKGMKKHIMRESLIGLSMGIVVGIVCAFAAFGFSVLGFMGGDLTTGQSALLGLAVGLSLIIVMTVAATIGFVVPYVLMKLNVDQAAATDPIITSIKDILGLLIYFGLVTLFLGSLIGY